MTKDEKHNLRKQQIEDKQKVSVYIARRLHKRVHELAKTYDLSVEQVYNNLLKSALYS